MAISRRETLGSLLLIAATAGAQDATQSQPKADDGLPKPGDDDPKLPNGKSQRDSIARQEHANALKDSDALVAAAKELRDELERAGDYVVPVSSLRKTEEIEKLAKRIRSRLKN